MTRLYRAQGNKAMNKPSQSEKKMNGGIAHEPLFFFKALTGR